MKHSFKFRTFFRRLFAGQEGKQLGLINDLRGKGHYRKVKND